MNKAEFFEVVKAAGLEPSAITDIEIDASGVVETAAIDVKNDAHLPAALRGGAASGLFCSHVRYQECEDGACWSGDASYEWNDSLSTYGCVPASDPSPTFTTLEEAVAEATSAAEEMAETLEREVEDAREAMSRTGALEICFTPQGWGVMSVPQPQFDLAA